MDKEPVPQAVKRRPSVPARDNVNAKLANPLAGLLLEELLDRGESYARENDMEDLVEDFRRAAVLAQDPMGFDRHKMFSEEEKAVLREEYTNKWKQPWELYFMVIMCSVAAAVQGMG